MIEIFLKQEKFFSDWKLWHVCGWRHALPTHQTIFSLSTWSRSMYTPWPCRKTWHLTEIHNCHRQQQWVRTSCCNTRFWNLTGGSDDDWCWLIKPGFAFTVTLSPMDGLLQTENRAPSEPKLHTNYFSEHILALCMEAPDWKDLKRCGERCQLTPSMQHLFYCQFLQGA